MTTDLPASPTTAAGISPRRRRLRRLILLLILIFAGFLTYGAMLPNEYRIQRSTTVHTDPSVVFRQVYNFHNWEKWSPWIHLDPDAVHTFSGPEFGEGAKFAWNGNDKAGEGDMTIVRSQPGEWLDIKLHFVRPMEDTANVNFTFVPTDDGTEVTWTMSGTHNFIGKIICHFMNMDKMLGGDFERGLASLKQASEQAASGRESSDSTPKPADQPE
ncbi:polyketide cyclase [bacterium]|nr:polyketide cyclase [bacterium]